jgi:hypothetical protein
VNDLVNRSKIASLFVAGMLANGCADRDILSHELSSVGHGDEATEPVNASATGSWDTDGDSSIEPRQGNFPEPAVSICGDLPPNVAPLPGLVSAWAVEVDEGKIVNGTPTAANGLRLTLSNGAFGCADRLTLEGPSVPSSCEETLWWLGMTLQPEVGVGIHDFDETPGIFPEVLSWAAECHGEAVGGYGGYEPTDSPVGRIEVHSMTPDCVVGTLHYFEFGLSGDLAELSGGFVAQRCNLECLPGPDGSC